MEYRSTNALGNYVHYGGAVVAGSHFGSGIELNPNSSNASPNIKPVGDETNKTLTITGKGTGALILGSATSPLEVPDDALLTLGDDNDQVLVNRSAALNADTALTSVLLGTPVTSALAANSLIISNVTASGDILIAANRGGNSEEYIFIDSSAGVLYLEGLQGGITLGLAADAPAPDNARVHIWDGSAGSVTAPSDTVLVLERGTDSGIGFLTPNTANATFYFGDVDDNDVGYFQYAHATNRMTLVVNAGNAMRVNENRDVMAIGGLLMDTRTSTAVTTDGNATYTAAQLLGGIITRSAITSNRVDAFDTAANIVAAIPGAVAGMTFDILVNNNDDASTITVNGASTGITYEGAATALAAGEACKFTAVLTDVTGGMEAVTVYQCIG